MSNYTTYVPFGGLIINHSKPSDLVLQDGWYYRSLDIDARVKSGDYLIALASELDQLCETITDQTQHLQLEAIVNDLLYLHGNYKIEKQENE